MTTGRRGRPEILPWKDEMDDLLARRRAGATFIDLADYLADRYNIAITAQAVRARLSAVIPPEERKEIVEKKAAERSAAEISDAQRIADWLLAHPASNMRETARALQLPLYRVDALIGTARTLGTGYTIPSPKERVQEFSDDDMLDVLEDTHDALGLASDAPLSQVQYTRYRDRQPERYQHQMPSPLAYRRRFGTWTAAVEAAGLASNPLPRSYDGLTNEDISLWLATWLRTLRESNQGIIEASQATYRKWLRDNPQAPSEELIRMRGAWTRTLSMAAEIERSKKDLPAPKPVGTTGRLKSTKVRYDAKV